MTPHRPSPQRKPRNSHSTKLQGRIDYRKKLRKCKDSRKKRTKSELAPSETIKKWRERKEPTTKTLRSQQRSTVFFPETGSLEEGV